MELQLVGAGHYEAARGKDFPLHKHTEWEIVCYRAGGIQAVVGRDVYDTAPGVVVVTPPGIEHAEYARTAYANYFLNIAAPENRLWPRVCMDDGDQSLTHIARRLVREWYTYHADRERMIALLLQELDLLLLRASAPPLSAEERLVIDAERYMQEYYQRSLSIGEIAGALGVSISTLRRHMVKVHGCTPIHFLHRLRARRACELLRTSNLTLEAIAGHCGYDSASHLSRHIKSVTGKSPGDWRKREG